MKQKPKLSFDHLVRERYPTFQDALRDVDDALCVVHLYAMLPSGSTSVCIFYKYYDCCEAKT